MASSSYAVGPPVPTSLFPYLTAGFLSVGLIASGTFFMCDEGRDHTDEPATRIRCAECVCVHRDDTMRVCVSIPVCVCVCVQV